MMSGFDKYFQIAPCFRDEDGRADRLAEFYQLDVEMSFVSQDDVFNTMQPVIAGIFEEFNDFTGAPHKIEWMPHITYADSMLKYGSDKPDLRNPLEIVDVTSVFARDDVEFKAFKSIVEKGGVVRAIKAPSVADQPRSFFDKLNTWAQGEGAFGMGYIQFADGEGKGPIAKFVTGEAQAELRTAINAVDGDAVFFVCDKVAPAEKMAGKARDAICDALPEGHAHARETGVFKFAWIIDYPMFERDEQTGEIDFSHNPFSMPQGGMDALDSDTPENTLAFQYDCICNGFELCSGAIRNHKPEIMEKAFGMAGYEKSVLEDKFGGMLSAFQYGAPPHGGCAFGIDRIVMLLANEPNLREVYAFVMNGQYQDLMMSAPSHVDESQLKDLHIKLNMPKDFVKKDEVA
jgi:aspartyl-tRNA synthetase